MNATIKFPPVPKPTKPALTLWCFKAWNEFCNAATASDPQLSAYPAEFIGFNNEMMRVWGEEAAGTWMPIWPYGDVPNHVKGKIVIQRFDQLAATEMVNNFNSAIGKVANLLRGAPLYIGHPDSTDPEMQRRYTDMRAYGRFKELAARTDALWGRLFASPAGKEMINTEQFLYLSPRGLASDKPIAVENGREIYRPIWLASVGLTDNPNIKTAAPLSFVNEQANPKPKENSTVNKELLIFIAGLLGFENEAKAAGDEIPTALTDKVRGGLQKMKKDAASAATLTTDLANEKTAHGATKDLVTKAQTEFNNERTARVAEALADGLELGRITAADQADWERRLKTDFVNEFPALRKLPVKVKTGSVTAGHARGAVGGKATEGLARCTELINEQFNKLPATMKHADRWLKATLAAKKANPEVFGPQADAGTE